MATEGPVPRNVKDDSSSVLGGASLFRESRVVSDDEKRAVRKLDYTVLPVMTMFYFLSFLVRCLSF